MYVEQSQNEKLQPEYAIKGLTLDQLNAINEMATINHLHYGDPFDIELSEKIDTCIKKSIKRQIIKSN